MGGWGSGSGRRGRKATYARSLHLWLSAPLAADRAVGTWFSRDFKGRGFKLILVKRIKSSGEANHPQDGRFIVGGVSSTAGGCGKGSKKVPTSQYLQGKVPLLRADMRRQRTYPCLLHYRRQSEEVVNLRDIRARGSVCLRVGRVGADGGVIVKLIPAD